MQRFRWKARRQVKGGERSWQGKHFFFHPAEQDTMKKKLSGPGILLMLMLKHPPLPEFNLFQKSNHSSHWETGVPDHPLPILVDHLNLLISNTQGWIIYFGEDWSKRALSLQPGQSERFYSSFTKSSKRYIGLFCANRLKIKSRKKLKLEKRI